MEFTSAICIYEMGDLIEENPKHEDMMNTSTRYKERVNKFYNLLNKACASGNAHQKIKKYESMMDGYQAWKELVKYYFAKGNVEAYATTNMMDLANLSLDYNSPGGIKEYISKYQMAVNNLEEIQQPISDVLKKTFFLNGIKDPYYRSIKSICEAQCYDINKCIIEVQREGSNQTQSTREKRNRHVNNIKQGKFDPKSHTIIIKIVEIKMTGNTRIIIIMIIYQEWNGATCWAKITKII